MANKKFNIGFISSHGHAADGHIIDLAANPELESIHLCVMNDKDTNQRDLDINKVAKASEKVKTKTKNIDDILYKDSGADSELDYIGQTSWVMFLRYLDELEAKKVDEAELRGEEYSFLIDEKYRWNNWAMPKGSDGKIDHNIAMTGTDLVQFVDGQLFPYMAGFKHRADSPKTIEYKIHEGFPFARPRCGRPTSRNPSNSGNVERENICQIPSSINPLDRRTRNRRSDSRGRKMNCKYQIGKVVKRQYYNISPPVVKNTLYELLRIRKRFTENILRSC